MIHLRLVVEILDPRSQSLLLCDVTRPSAVLDEFIRAQLEVVPEKVLLWHPRAVYKHRILHEISVL